MFFDRFSFIESASRTSYSVLPIADFSLLLIVLNILMSVKYSILLVTVPLCALHALPISIGVQGCQTLKKIGMKTNPITLLAGRRAIFDTFCNCDSFHRRCLRFCVPTWTFHGCGAARGEASGVACFAASHAGSCEACGAASGLDTL
jgi:hypothetical protein